METAPGTSPKPTLSEREFLALGDDVRAELWDGELVALPNPSGVHQDIAAELITRLRGPYHHGRGGPGGWLILPDVDLRLKPRRIVRPDLSGWRRERLDTVPAQVPIDVIPDWVCEILSPSTARHDRGRKLPAYATAGIGHAWIIDPERRTLEVFARKGKHFSFLGAWGDDDVVPLAPFDAAPIAVSELFPGPRLAHEPPVAAYAPGRQKVARTLTSGKKTGPRTRPSSR